MKFYKDAICDDRTRAKAQRYLDNGTVVEVLYEFRDDKLSVRDIQGINPDKVIRKPTGEIGFLVDDNFPKTKIVEIIEGLSYYFPTEEEMKQFILPKSMLT